MDFVNDTIQRTLKLSVMSCGLTILDYINFFLKIITGHYVKFVEQWLPSWMAMSI